MLTYSSNLLFKPKPFPWNICAKHLFCNMQWFNMQFLLKHNATHFHGLHTCSIRHEACAQRSSPGHLQNTFSLQHTFSCETRTRHMFFDYVLDVLVIKHVGNVFPIKHVHNTFSLQHEISCETWPRRIFSELPIWSI